MTGTIGERRAAFRDRVRQRDALLVPGAGNALTARMIAAKGFEAVYVTGAGIANTQLGVPDIGLTTMTELASAVSAMADVTDAPLVVDIDTGYGNALNTRRTVRTLERAGAFAVQLEDQVFPKRCGHFSGKAVIAVSEAAAKVRAAVDAREDPNLLVIARTDARAVEGLDAALDRAAAYIDSGADLTFVEAPQSVEELRCIAERLPVPQVANMVFGGATPLVPRQALAEMGFALTLYANAPLQAAMKAMDEVLGALHRDGSLDAVGDRLADFEARQIHVGKPGFDALDRRYTSD
ncbi:MAG: isocitrate lyase/phosphoenolpyruvate mutase family protein [Pseudomonadota bacterium]